MRLHSGSFQIIWFPVVVFLTIACFYLYLTLRDNLCHFVVYNYSYLQLPYGDQEIDGLYLQISKEIMLISHELWHMGQAGNDSDHFRSLLKDMSIQLEARFNVMDQLTGKSERKRERLINLSKRLEDQLHHSQNPPNCTLGSFLVTDLPLCGFGCQVHHVALMLHTAFAINRTLFITGNHWHNIFYPITNCTYAGTDAIHQNLPLSLYEPPGLRRNWAEALQDIHGFPYAWFRGHLVRYTLRLRPSAFQAQLLNDLNVVKATPTIGIHVRRTDKLIWEAKFYPLSQYMENVERIYQILNVQESLVPGKRQLRRTVMLASDDPQVFEEARTLYSNYTFVGQYHGGHLSARNSRAGTENIVSDIFHLANCDYVVCTFSSNVCRLVYELLLTDVYHYGDRAAHVQSIDSIYSMNFQRQRSWTIIGSTPEADLKKGDTVTIKENFWNGSVKTIDNKVLPAYIVKENVLQHP